MGSTEHVVLSFSLALAGLMFSTASYWHFSRQIEEPRRSVARRETVTVRHVVPRGQAATRKMRRELRALSPDTSFGVSADEAAVRLQQFFATAAL